MNFEQLTQFIERDMRMAHVYQPVMLRELLDRGGRATREDIARALLNEDRSQLDYYSEITRNMVWSGAHKSAGRKAGRSEL